MKKKSERDRKDPIILKTIFGCNVEMHTPRPTQIHDFPATLGWCFNFFGDTPSWYYHCGDRGPRYKVP